MEGLASSGRPERHSPADVGTGTVFLYAKSKAELLLLLVHNVKFADAIETGVAAASAAPDQLDALMATARVEAAFIDVLRRGDNRTLSDEEVVGVMRDQVAVMLGTRAERSDTLR